jgi:hypothetical protein
VLPALSFDLIISVNVLEHAPDPLVFLAGVRQVLTPGGTAFIVCPDGDQPNSELLFADHLYSFTDLAFARLASHAGLHITGRWAAPNAVGQFVLRAIHPLQDNRERLPTPGDTFGPSVHRARVALLESWRALDKRLTERLGHASDVTAFGIGEAAALLRAYAPLSWSKVRCCTADVVPVSTFFGLPVTVYGQLSRNVGLPLLLAVQPGAQTKLGSRLAADGWRVIAWDDLVCGMRPTANGG